MEALVSLGEAARMLQCHDYAIKYACRLGTVKPLSFGQRRLFDTDDIETLRSWLDTGRRIYRMKKARKPLPV